MQPSQVGSYLIERKIGTGGMGTVYYGRHQETGQEAAIKVLPASLAREEGFVARFNREVETMQQLKSPNIVQFYESGTEDDTYYFAMEYVDGETLTDRMRRENRLHWETVIDVALQVCAALKAAHDAGIIHRDLKPSNLLITEDGTVKLTDFGVAQVFAATRLTATGNVIGTAEYMAPEQSQGGRVTKKSDLYALGTVMYAMLTGRPPFTGKTMLEVVQKHQYGQFDRPRMVVPEIPHWLDEIVCQLLEKDPDKRIPDALVLSKKLQEVRNKVSLSGQQMQVGDTDHYDGDAPTVAPGERRYEPGPATVMRDLMKADLEREQHGTLVERLLNNTWVLLGLLVLIVAGGYWWFRPQQLSPEERFQRGVERMQQEPGPEWLTARDEDFLPLLESDPDRWRDRVEEYLRDIRVYELRRELKLDRSLRRSDEASSEPVRLLKLANEYRRLGDVARAERILTSLSALLDQREEYQGLREVAQEMLQDLRETGDKEPSRTEFLKSSLARADNLSEDGEIDQARRIWRSIVELYGSDPEAAEHVERARQRLSVNKTAADATGAETDRPPATDNGQRTNDK